MCSKDFRLSMLGLLGVLCANQGCHCWGWYHYHNCYVYLGAPPGAKTYGHGYWPGWPYAPAWAGPVPYASYSPGAYAPPFPGDYAVSPDISSYEQAPMPRLQGSPKVPPDESPPDQLIPPPRKVPSDAPPVPPPPLPPKGQAPDAESRLHQQSLRLEIQGPRQLNMTQPGQLRIVLSNSAEVSLQDVELVLHLPKPIRAETIQPAGQVRGQEISWALGHLGPRVREVFTVQLKAQNTANAAVCYATALAADGTGAAASWAIRILPAE
ncbi:hypothetical protein HRbin36_01959 [bacterium HR36]|nr:hypothetical protein HRbin36_01959 [bacterium HR36]